MTIMEMNSAVDFICKILKGKNHLTAAQLQTFHDELLEVMATRYRDHWFPEKPDKGSAYRCIRIVKGQLDPMLARAGVQAGFNEAKLLHLFPSELTLWVDPNEVSYRFGEDGSVGVIYGHENSDPHRAADLSPSPTSSLSDRESSQSPPTTSDSPLMFISCQDQYRHHGSGSPASYSPSSHHRQLYHRSSPPINWRLTAVESS